MSQLCTIPFILHLSSTAALTRTRHELFLLGEGEKKITWVEDGRTFRRRLRCVQLNPGRRVQHINLHVQQGGPHSGEPAVVEVADQGARHLLRLRRWSPA